jgi:hypothetical protein
MTFLILLQRLLLLLSLCSRTAECTMLRPWLKTENRLVPSRSEVRHPEDNESFDVGDFGRRYELSLCVPGQCRWMQFLGWLPSAAAAFPWPQPSGSPAPRSASLSPAPCQSTKGSECCHSYHLSPRIAHLQSKFEAGGDTRQDPSYRIILLYFAHSACRRRQNAQAGRPAYRVSPSRLSRLSKFDCIANGFKLEIWRIDSKSAWRSHIHSWLWMHFVLTALMVWGIVIEHITQDAVLYGYFVEERNFMFLYFYF